jgi:phospholipase/carboxylesterase
MPTTMRALGAACAAKLKKAAFEHSRRPLGMDEQIEIGPEIGAAAAVAILVHGRGRTPEEMRDIALRLERPDIRFIMPRAEGGSWYPKGFLAPVSENEPFLSRSLARYEALINDALARGAASRRLILGGFSQGACLTAQTLWRRPDRYGAALIFTGGLIGEPGTRWSPAPELRDTPILLTSSEIDEWVPLSRVEETAQALRASGAALSMRIYKDRAHEISEDELVLARGALAKAIG